MKETKKKLLSLILAGAMSTSFVGCSKSDEEETVPRYINGSELKIIALYDKDIEAIVSKEIYGYFLSDEENENYIYDTLKDKNIKIDDEFINKYDIYSVNYVDYLGSSFYSGYIINYLESDHINKRILWNTSGDEQPIMEGDSVYLLDGYFHERGTPYKEAKTEMEKVLSLKK